MTVYKINFVLFLTIMLIHEKMTHAKLTRQHRNTNMHLNSEYTSRLNRLSEGRSYHPSRKRFVRDRRSKNYCASRRWSTIGKRIGCCAGRNDDCSMPYYDTMCYCDEFCHRTNSGDCCPDYFDYCWSNGVFITEHLSQPTTITYTNEFKKNTPGKTSTLTQKTSSDILMSTSTYSTSTSEATSTTKTTTTSSKNNQNVAPISPITHQLDPSDTTSITTTMFYDKVTATSKHHGSLDKVCYFNGGGYKLGEVIARNCNKCTCRKLFNNGYYDFVCEKNPCLIVPNIIDVINAGDYGWVASNYTFLWGLTRGEGFALRLGTVQSPEEVRNMSELFKITFPHLPETFDSRKKWKGLILPPRDQGNCGSSWAFSSTSVASDRIAIQSGGRLKVDLSPQQMISCKYPNKNGCHGDRVDAAWWFLRRKGVRTSKCYPYTSGYDNKVGICKVKSSNEKCSGGDTIRTTFKTGPPYRIAPNEEEIKLEIYENGPVQAVILISQDFFYYKSGIYTPLPFIQMTNESHHHSVKIIGWGQGQGPFGIPTNYWLVQNSWGTKWGEKGYFRIVRGSNTSGIESMILAVWPKIDTLRKR